ncbi:MAG: NHLP bacteriocin export ABC transporter permease/ATPase subunit [Hyphomicrobiaceae bacterium]|nr:NHLP bacteriocin export ABC transporter permease/ATPase subunit [Hyphomicrobiaceae bacterium]
MRPRVNSSDIGSGRADAAADASVLERLERSHQATKREVARRLRQLGAVDEGRHTQTGIRATGAAAEAAIRVLEAGGMEIEDSSRQVTGIEFDEVPLVCRALGAAAREVVLPRGWWKEDQGHLVGLLRVAGHDDRTVSLIKGAIGGYVVHDAEAGTSTPLTAELVDRIAPRAYAVYPALPEETSGLRNIARFLWPALKSDMWRVMLASLVMGLIGLLIPLATGLVIDQLIPSREISLLYQFGAGLVMASVLTSAFTILQHLALAGIDGRSQVLLQAASWNRVLRLPASFFKSYASGDLQQRMSGIEAMRNVVLSVALSAAITVFFSIFYLGLLFYYDAQLAFAALAIVLVLAVATFLAGLLQLKYHKRQAIVSGWLSGFVFQVLQAIVKLRVAGGEQRAFARWASRYADQRAAIMSTRRISNHFAAFSEAYSILSLATLYGLLGYLGGLGLTAGTFIAFLAAFGAFQSAFLGLSGAVLQLIAVMPHYQRAKPILDAKVEQKPHSAEPGALSGAITISHLTFAYEAGASPVLKDLCLEIQPGDSVAIVGPSGSGKSTLLRLLLGLETPQGGTVLYDGQDLSSLNLSSVRRQIGVVLQTGRVFAGTIFENIRGATNATFEDCLSACEAAGFAEDLASFPMGLHTPLTEGAATISGGQRQRLLIARALVGKPRMLFMDEATSALDNRTQSIVTASLDHLAVTRVVIAHRLSTVRNTSTIVVIDRGLIVEKGTFDELMAAGGLFSELARKQLT